MIKQLDIFTHIMITCLCTIVLLYNSQQTAAALTYSRRRLHGIWAVYSLTSHHVHDDGNDGNQQNNIRQQYQQCEIPLHMASEFTVLYII